MGKTAIELSGFAREPKLSTLLGGVRSLATCKNAGSHGGPCEIHGKDGVGGSIPPGGSTTALTSGSSATACASGAGEVAATASALVGCSAGGSEGTAEIATVCRAGPCHVAASSEWRPCCATGYSYLSRRASQI